MKKGMIVFFVIFILSISLCTAGLLQTRGLEDIPNSLNLKKLCIDTDSNKEQPEYKRGYVQDINGIYWDECNSDINGADLIERVCEDGFVKDRLIDCERGCYLGACAKFSFFKLPKVGYLPASQKFLSFQRFTESRFAETKEEDSKYDLSLFNLVVLNEILKDIDKRLRKLEELDGLKEGNVFPLIIRLTAVESLGGGEILRIKYYGLNEWSDVEATEYTDPDLEIFVEESSFEDLKNIFEDGEVKEKLNLFDNLRIVSFNEKGKKAKEEISKLL